LPLRVLGVLGEVRRGGRDVLGDYHFANVHRPEPLESVLVALGNFDVEVREVEELGEELLKELQNPVKNLRVK
jgi:hypothetical protein